MASSDLIDSHRASESVSAQADSLAAESAESSQGGNESGDAVTEKRVALPKPDTNNITVLTESLPNDPILPWHHFDSPWLEKEEPAAEETPVEEPTPSADDDNHEQLSLALDEVSDVEIGPELDNANGDPKSTHSMD
ncbi:MAG: hypothetical protein ACHWZW_11380 [Spirulina sp.]